MNILKELIEDIESDKEIANSFIPKDELTLDIFDKEGSSYRLKDEVRNKLLNVSDEFLNFLDVDFFVHDIVLTGSLSNFNWSKYSDVDLHILMDLDELSSSNADSVALHGIIKNFFDSKKNLWNSNTDIKIKGYEVELYVQDVDEPHISSGVYSILNNEWVVEPKKLESAFELDKDLLISKSEVFMKQIDDLHQRSEKGEDVTKSVDDLKNKIKKYRQSGLEGGGEYSYENLVFKLLRRNGYIERLLDIKGTIRDKKLSLPQ